jgi:formylglycine-generating enzyme required for sulfatase activity
MKPEVVPIPAGSFLMGCEGGQENEQPVHRVWLDAFAIGKFPVTNQEYNSYVEDQHAPPPRFWSEPMFRQPEQPVVGVSWYEALAYCAWLSKRDRRVFRLPSEAEWERAARGGLEGALYPWGDAPPSQRPYAGYDSETGGPQKAGANESNGFGLYDMSEGVHEWCSDYFGCDYYRLSPKRNPRGPTGGPRRASRGGSWRHRVKFSRCAARSSLPPDYQYADYGFRVAMTL